MVLYVVAVILQVIAPIALLAWVWAARGRRRGTTALRVSMATAYLVAIALAGLWLIVPWVVAIAYLAVLALMAYPLSRSAQTVAGKPRRRDRLERALTVLLAIVFVGLAAAAIGGRWPPAEQVVELEFPLRRGTYYVVSGGSNSLVNAHLQTLNAPRFRNYRGQSYGVDIVAINAAGLRSSGLLPRDPRAYVIFGAPIHAPCPGVVLRAEDGLPDMPPPEPDRERLPGNYVFLDCGGVHVLLAHMQQGTVRVRPGEHVQTGATLGLVGNSGNSNEPHVHIHAQRPAQDDAFLSGEPLPIRLSGRFLVRNDRIDGPE